jgi:GNAT superfamily N-acetyltransferase
VSGSAPGGYEPLTLTPGEREQIEEQLSACFGLTPAGARAWVATSSRSGWYYGWKVGETVAASVAFEPLVFGRGARAAEATPLRALLLQSHYVHPDYRGQGYRVREAFLDEVLERHGAETVVLCLYEDALAEYWREVGFRLEHGRELITVAAALARWAAALSPVVTDDYLAVKREEAEADGATIIEAGGLVLVRARGAATHTELLVADIDRALRAPPALLADSLEVTTIMSYPARRGLFCPVVV